MTTFEFPLNERIRTWLRLEDLFEKAQFFIQAGDARSHHAGLQSIFELVDVTARSELKSELIQELERQRNSLVGLRGNPAVDSERLENVLGQISEAQGSLHSMTGKIGQHIRDNEWLLGIKGRACIPGGACSFDLPVYHHWLHQDAPRRHTDLMAWISPMIPLKLGVEVLLRLLRESGKPCHYTAQQGQFQLMLGGRSAQMLQVAVNAPCAPEASANKYAINIRFLVPDTAQKPRACDQEVPFELAFCSL